MVVLFFSIHTYVENQYLPANFRLLKPDSCYFQLRFEIKRRLRLAHATQ